ncbi:MAG: ribonuclease HI [Anaerolineae bacterium]|nr:ribonuclease HI [Anaerolineae bacterium]
MNTITIYTDGSSIGNPGPGGWGAVLLAEGARKELSGGYRLTTNNRMEMMAVIEALSALKRPCQVDLYSDSKYVVDAINKGWAEGWRANRWKRGKQGKALNPDLWERLLDLLAVHQVTFHWVKGHADTPENQRCDRLAVAAAKKPNLPADAGYEKDDEPKALPLF